MLQLSLMAGALIRQNAIMTRRLFREPALKRLTLTLERFTREATRASTLAPNGVQQDKVRASRGAQASPEPDKRRPIV